MPGELLPRGKGAAPRFSLQPSHRDLNPQSQICLNRIRRCINLLPNGNPMRIQRAVFMVVVIAGCAFFASADSKPKLTLDEFFNSVSFSGIELSPDGNSVVIGTERADWDQQIFRGDLWLYRDDAKAGSLFQWTQAGHDSTPKWSPDGLWIAFLSERKTTTEKSSSDADTKD